jgi:phage-related protein
VISRFNRCQDCCDTDTQPAIEIAGTETGANLVVDNALTGFVRQRGLETEANLDLNFPLLLKDQENDPVVRVLLADAPSLCYANRVFAES